MEQSTIIQEVGTQDRELITQSEKLAAEFSIVKIEDQPQYDYVNGTLEDVRAKTKELEAKRLSITKPINDGLKSINDLFRRPRNTLEKLELKLKSLMGIYIAERRAAEAEKQRKIDAEAQKERDRLEEKARKEREKAEEKARLAREKAEELAKNAENEKQAEEIRRKAEAKAQAIEDKAEQKADIMQETADCIIAPEIASVDKGQGVYTVDTYSVEVEDKETFIRWALNANILEYVQINESLLNKDARNTKGERKWPGIKINKKTDVRKRA